MQTKFFKLIGALVLVAFLSGFVSGAMAAGQPSVSQANGKATVTTDQATISVTGGGNVPFYHIQLKNDNISYEVKFQNSLEFVDKNNDGMYQQNELVAQSDKQFPGIGWDFSGFSKTNDSNGNLANVDFNFTHTATANANPVTAYPTISLNNHINVTNGNQVKFDIVMNDYSWISSNASAKFAIKFQIAGGNLTSSSSEGLTFGGAYFNTVSTASSPSGDVNVATQIDSGNSFYLIFDHFDGNFTLDPLFGATSSNSGSSTSSPSSAPGFEAFSLLGGFAVIGLVYIKKRN